jgi:hypothetical protein
MPEHSRKEATPPGGQPAGQPAASNSDPPDIGETGPPPPMLEPPPNPGEPDPNEEKTQVDPVIVSGTTDENGNINVNVTFDTTFNDADSE